jgi:hypothetical protein
MQQWEFKHYAAHPQLKAAIEDTFMEERDRIIAWRTVGIIRDVFPEISDKFQGELLEITTQ